MYVSLFKSYTYHQRPTQSQPDYSVRSNSRLLSRSPAFDTPGTTTYIHKIYVFLTQGHSLAAHTTVGGWTTYRSTFYRKLPLYDRAINRSNQSNQSNQIKRFTPSPPALLAVGRLSLHPAERRSPRLSSSSDSPRRPLTPQLNRHPQTETQLCPVN